MHTFWRALCCWNCLAHQGCIDLAPPSVPCSLARSHPDEYFGEIRFLNENHYTDATCSHVPEQLCGNFCCKLDRRSPKSYLSEILAAIRSRRSLPAFRAGPNRRLQSTYLVTGGFGFRFTLAPIKGPEKAIGADKPLTRQHPDPYTLKL